MHEIDPGRIPEPMDIKIELFSGDETLLQTWDYNGCNRHNYEIYLDDSLMVYKLHEICCGCISEIIQPLFSSFSV